MQSPRPTLGESPINLGSSVEVKLITARNEYQCPVALTQNVIIPPNGCCFIAFSENIGASDAPNGSLEKRRRWLLRSPSVNQDLTPSDATLPALGARNSPSGRSVLTLDVSPEPASWWLSAWDLPRSHFKPSRDPPAPPPQLVPLKDGRATCSDPGFPAEDVPARGASSRESAFLTLAFSLCKSDQKPRDILELFCSTCL